MDSAPLQIFQSVSNSSNDVDLDEFLHVQRLCDGASTPPNDTAQAQTCLDEIVIPAAASDEIHHKQKRQDDTKRGNELNQSHTKPRRRGIRSSVSSIPEYSVICFPSNPTKPNGIKKKRKDFDEKRRQEVAQVRKSGACFRCKFRRISCGVGAPCQACEKAAGILGRELCIREKLTKMRFSSGDLHYIDYTARLLDQELVAGTTHLGPHRKVSLSMDYPGNPALEVEVQDYYGNTTPPWFCCWVVTDQVGGQVESYRQESARYALPQLLPPSHLVDWVERIIAHQETRCIGFQQTVDSFILRYSQSKSLLPMHDFVRKVHKLNCLTKIRLGLILCVEEGGDMTPPSCALHTQFGQISKAASQPIEKGVLLELEKLVFGTTGIGSDNSVALWASLWCLILMYRKLVHTYMAFRQFPCHVPEDYSGFPECKLEVGTHFYHHLVSIYAAIFRVTSPLYADFRLASTRKLLDDDESLIEAFMSLRTESFYFQRESMSMSASPDQLLRRMILDREAGLRPKQLGH
ncbi:hypothetical protein FPOAC1_001037 [Fusarium poae]|uniref:hypothetical protein n=1 Tax=Fusarium poae TaxID=36050 RepID=UPI001CE96353|nr:hypothetical protein FPOAC1_001037 [Fusarium poae]KAG8675060.1 hypothetical protein FPOAC1_001037 [Fusarium poae]